MRRRLAVFGALLAGLCLTGAASAATIVVRPGESIQAAIDGGSPGDTILVRPGTYHENLTIQKDNLTLKASEGPGSVLLMPAREETPSICSDWRVNGICVAGQVDEHLNPVGPPVRGTRIVGFTVARFPGSGILLVNASDSAISRAEVHGNLDYGIIGWALTTVRFVHNLLHHNRLSGIYLLDSPKANATLTGNEAYRNVDPDCWPQFCESWGAGFLISDSSHGIVRNNRAWDNCVGYEFLDSFDPGQLSDWRVTGNSALHNSVPCPAWIPSSEWWFGIGVLLRSTDHVVVSGNVIEHNAGPPRRAGGVILMSDPYWLGAPSPTDNVIKDNVALTNNPFDIRWDETGSGNVFATNVCRTSEPSWICTGS